MKDFHGEVYTVDRVIRVSVNEKEKTLLIYSFGNCPILKLSYYDKDELIKFLEYHCKK